MHSLYVVSDSARAYPLSVLLEVACVLSDWGAWSACSATCGSPSDGAQNRARTITTEPLHGGTPCEELHEIRNAKPRNPRHLDGIKGGRKRVSDILLTKTVFDGIMHS